MYRRKWLVNRDHLLIYPDLKLQFHLFLSYIGPVVLKDILPRELLQHFFQLHVAVKILSHDNFCTSYHNFANDLLHLYVKNCKTFFGPSFITCNVHNPIHLSDDVIRFGALFQFSAFPFENYLQTLKKFLRKHEHVISQVVCRIKEIEINLILDEKESFENISVLRPHKGGPILNNFPGYFQFKQLKTKGVTLTCNRSDSCVVLKNPTDGHRNIVFVIKNIIKRNCRVFLLGHRFNNVENLFIVPCDSDLIGVQCASELSDCFEAMPISQFLYKAFLFPTDFPLKDKFAIYPLYMVDNCVED